jgi:hypothetical protein
MTFDEWWAGKVGKALPHPFVNAWRECWESAQESLKAEILASQEPVATLHDDGYYTWKGAESRRRYKDDHAGWRMDVYATPLPTVDVSGGVE